MSSALEISRRRFIKGAAGVASVMPLAETAQAITKAKEKVKTGIDGSGGRGLWIGRLPFNGKFKLYVG